MELKHDGEIDVYGFLHMVRGTDMVNGMDTGCLGTEVDHLNERENMDLCLSPEIDVGSEKPSFEDCELFNGAFEDQPRKSSWDNAGLAKGDSWSGWDWPDSSKKLEDDSSESGGWGGSASWGKNSEVNTNKPETGPSSWGSDKKAEENNGSEQGWKKTSGAKESDSSQYFGSRKGEGMGWSSNTSDRNDASAAGYISKSDGWESLAQGVEAKTGGKCEDSWGRSVEPTGQESENQHPWEQQSPNHRGSDWDCTLKFTVQSGEKQDTWGQQNHKNKGDDMSAQPSGWPGWKKDKIQTQDDSSMEDHGNRSELRQGKEAQDSWKSGAQTTKDIGWVCEVETQDDDIRSNWCSAVSPKDMDGGWVSKKDDDSFSRSDGWNGQGWEKSEGASQFSKDWKNKDDDSSSKADQWNDLGWGKKPGEASLSPKEWTRKSGDVSMPKADGWNISDWGKKSEEGSRASKEWNRKDDVSTPKADGWNSSGWEKKSGVASQSSGEWTKKDDVSTPKADGWNSLGWGKKSEASESPKEWSKNNDVSTAKADGWTSVGWGKKSEASQSLWTMKNDVSAPKSDGWTSSGWGKKSREASQSPKEWTKKDDVSTPKDDGWANSGWGKKSEEASQSPNEWTKKDDVCTPKDDGWTSSGWGKKSEEGDQSSKGWTSSQGAEESKSQNPWAPKERRKNQDGTNRRGSNPEWKIKKNRPPRPPESSQQDPNAPRLFTATRQRLDMFTSEEQDILSDVEPVMQSIRRIMRQAG